MGKKLWSTARLQCLIDCSFDERTPTRLLVILAWLRWLIEFRPMWDGCIISIAGRPFRLTIPYVRQRTLRRERAVKRERYVIVTRVDEAPAGCTRINGEWPPAVKAVVDRLNAEMMGRKGHGN